MKVSAPASFIQIREPNFSSFPCNINFLGPIWFSITLRIEPGTFIKFHQHFATLYNTCYNNWLEGYSLGDNITLFHLNTGISYQKLWPQILVETERQTEWGTTGRHRDWGWFRSLPGGCTGLCDSRGGVWTAGTSESEVNSEKRVKHYAFVWGCIKYTNFYLIALIFNDKSHIHSINKSSIILFLLFH